MRISDWSSDVCSSDLSRSVLTPPLPEGAASWTGLRGAASALAIAQLAQQHSQLIVALAANEQHAYQLEAELRFFLGELPLVHHPTVKCCRTTSSRRIRKSSDRKSVVSGKSVSVRVNPGGRRIINKNNKYTYYTE